MQIRITAAFALLIASSLNAQTTAPVAAPAAVTPSPIPDLSTATPIAGNWSYAATADGSEANFLNPISQIQVTIHCARAARRITVSKPASGAAPFLAIWTSAQSRNIPASYNPATTRISADLNANDQLLDAIAFSRGRIGVGISGQPQVVVPAWAEAARVVEDCRA
jgi:hypothetical protein